MVSPRRGEGTPPYRCFVGLQHIIKCSVRNGLDRSLQIVFQLVPISIKPTSKRRTTRWFYDLVGRKGMRIYYIVLGIVMIVIGLGVALNILE